MRAAVFHAPGDVRVAEVPDPKIEEPTDVVARIRRAAICGSDLWAYRGDVDTEGRAAGRLGDGAVGLCGVLASARIGAERIVSIGRHADRLELAKRFGATDVVNEHDGDTVGRVLELTGGGAPSALECVGFQSSMDIALSVTRPGGTAAFVGIPIGVETVDLQRMFGENIALRGGVAPVRAYLPELLRDVLDGRLDPSPVLDMTVDLDGVPDGYRAMTDRTAVKVMVEVG